MRNPQITQMGKVKAEKSNTLKVTELVEVPKYRRLRSEDKPQINAN